MDVNPGMANRNVSAGNVMSAGREDGYDKFLFVAGLNEYKRTDCA